MADRNRHNVRRGHIEHVKQIFAAICSARNIGSRLECFRVPQPGITARAFDFTSVDVEDVLDI